MNKFKMNPADYDLFKGWFDSLRFEEVQEFNGRDLMEFAWAKCAGNKNLQVTKLNYKIRDLEDRVNSRG